MARYAERTLPDYPDMTNAPTVSISAAGKLVSDFHTLRTASTKAGNKASTDYGVATRNRLYSLLSSASQTTESLLELPAEVFAQLCVDYGTKPAGEGENPASPCVRMMFRTKQNGKDVPDKSAWKYGKAIRWALEHKWPLEEKKFIEKMNAFEFKKDGKVLKRMIAVEAAYDAKWGDKDAEQALKVEQAAQAFLVSQEPAATFMCPLGIAQPQNGQLVSVVASYDAATGSWAVRGVAQADHAAAWRSIRTSALADFQKARDELAKRIASDVLSREAEAEDVDALLARLVQHNADTDALNAKVGTFRKLTEWKQDDAGFVMPTEHVVTDEPVTTRDDQNSATA